MENVWIAKCENYVYEEVEKAVFQCMDGSEELKKKALEGKKFLVKVNLLKKNDPEDAVTTHPFVAEAIVRYLQKKKCKVILGDSPGGPFTPGALRAVYRASGMQEVAERTGCELNYNTSTVEIHLENAKMLSTMQIIKVVQDVDYVISAAKLKTHGMMTFTGAVKNLFGVVPGLIKAEYHLKMKNVENFAEHLVDICEYVKPVFSLIDGIEGMEGNGPSGGDKRKVGLILSSDSPYALDALASHIIGLDPLNVPVTRAARGRGIFSGEISDIKVQGAALEEIHIPAFKLPNSILTTYAKGKLPKFLERAVLNGMQPRPVFNHSICISCRDCARSCPAEAIDMSTKKPVVDLDKCIRCFCCHELCPAKAIDIKTNWIYGRVFGRRSRKA